MPSLRGGCLPELEGSALAPTLSVAAKHIPGWSISLNGRETAPERAGKSPAWVLLNPHAIEIGRNLLGACQTITVPVCGNRSLWSRLSIDTESFRAATRGSGYSSQPLRVRLKRP
jgi:hypothetical protein